ncbi:helicase-related protein [Laceyella sacchari]|uniref:Helicase-related protein n=1 Tax=Laceyella sacchari TaxID=37482 RepID=A0ABY5U5H4_LACSH|nr:helicase-related protein [Laceyella sacchari]UWE04240.1 helicase-related protein [Laceyella sacchari]
MTEIRESRNNQGLRSREWLLSYKTSSTMIGDRPVNMLHDFYIPALSRAVRYDRVAGYFRSTSLAAASQGFSAFANQGGKMRLIVGADLEPNDVKAILQGDAKRLSEKLTEELEQADSWPEGVRNGVTLLAWMVEKGYLEVRVAFRLHKDTGEPISFDSMEDGYVHEKWFLFTDEYGNRMYGAGSLNESKTALHLNAENIDIHCDWWGETDRKRVDEAAESFETLWEGKVRHIRVLTLPEAVRRRLVRFAQDVKRPLETDGTSEIPEPSTKAEKVQPDGIPSALERLKFAVLRDAPKMPGGRYVGLETAPVEPWPHQIMVVRRLVENWPYSYLLCDEVGLGKTIEAGLAIRCLHLAGWAKRILIAAPASLTTQWQRQLASKLLLSFGRVMTPGIRHHYLLPVEEDFTSGSFYEPNLVIVSTGLMSRRERIKQLEMAEEFDIVLVDEAHMARRKNPSKGAEANPQFGHLYTTIRDHLRGRTRSLWLATATPMQIHPVEVSDLIALTNRVGAFQYDPTLTMKYYDILGRLLQGEKIGSADWDFLRRSILGTQRQDHKYWEFLTDVVISGRIRSDARQWLEFNRVPRGTRNQQLMSRLIFSASPLSRVMLRHTRQLLEIYRENGELQQNLAKREIRDLPQIRFNALERKIYDQLEEYCKGLVVQIGPQEENKQMISFLLSFLRLRFASSLYAFQKTIERRLKRVEETLRHQYKTNGEEYDGSGIEDLVFNDEVEEEDPGITDKLLKNRTPVDLRWEQERLKKMLKDMEELHGQSSKMLFLLRELDNRRNRQTRRIRQTVIFTRFYDTLVDIVQRLKRADPEMRIGTYSGKGAGYYDSQAQTWVNTEREEVKERFLRGEIDILVCTDAAAEGLNLQTADLLINYDLGWNPMKIEQRIGRIDRIGQKHEVVYVLNLCYVDSVESIVYGRLLQRLKAANLIVGTQQLALLPVDPQDFQELAQGTLTPEELEYRIRERIEEQRKHLAYMEINPKDLYEIYKNMNGFHRRWQAPIDLQSIWSTLTESRYLQELGCKIFDENNLILEINHVDGVPDGSVLTVSRELYESGLPDGKTRVHFASYGDPYFDAILRKTEKMKLPSCVRRISVDIPDLPHVEIVGYAVLCKKEDGSRQVRFITKWDDLKGICLAEGEILNDPEIEPLRQQLYSQALDEFTFTASVKRIEGENTRAAMIQEMMNFLTGHHLLEERAKVAGTKARFGSVLRDVISLIEERTEGIHIAEMPGDVLRQVKDEVLFPLHVPKSGQNVTVLVPPLFCLTSVDSIKRMADRMKRQEKDIKVKSMITTLKREAKNRMESIF